MAVTLFALKLAILAFWTAWFLLVFAGNLMAALKAMQILPARWPWASSHYQSLCALTARAHLPGWVPVFLFYIIVVWQLLATTFFGIALLASQRGQLLDISAINAAFTVACCHGLALLLADEMFDDEQRRRSHALYLLLQMASLLCVHLLPP